MKFVIDDQVVLLRPPDGPLAPHLSSFAGFMREQGYATNSVRRQVMLAAAFSRWLAQRAVGVRTVTSDHAGRYLRYRVRHVRPGLGDAAALRYLLGFLRRDGVIPAEDEPSRSLTPAEQCVRDYENYLRDARALADTTIINCVPFARDFLKGRFGDGFVTLSSLEAGDVVAFVRRQAARLHLRRAKLMTTALRSFLQYTQFRGDVTQDLAASVPVVANWSMPSIPRAIDPDQVRQLLASIDRRTAIGRRDYAILLLLARLGLRSGEVAFLDLDDIDWDRGCLRVHGKSGQRGELPLPTDVGDAIVAYLRDGRPDSSCRRVFLRAKAPVRGFRGASGVGSVVRHAIQRAGVDAPTLGAHQFRHGLATEMLRQDASLAEIGEVLGHRSPQTTKIYTKVDTKSLRTLALPWPGGAR